jgi:hypothetical protein
VEFVVFDENQSELCYSNVLKSAVPFDQVVGRQLRGQAIAVVSELLAANKQSRQVLIAKQSKLILAGLNLQDDLTFHLQRLVHQPASFLTENLPRIPEIDTQSLGSSESNSRQLALRLKTTQTEGSQLVQRTDSYQD